MKLFTINPDTQEIDLNKEWIFLIPEFIVLLKRDKGSAGDYRGEKKLHARRELTYIYFMEDFGSPLRDWEDDKKKHEEALRCASLAEIQIDKEVRMAQAFYYEYLRKCAPTLATLDAMQVGMKELNKWFREIDFNKVDSLKRAKYTAKDYIENVKSMPKMNASIKEFERQVWEELKEATGIRGNKKLGLMEGQRNGEWEEGGAPATDRFSVPVQTIEV